MKIIGIAGESGTGKTTIAQHLADRGAVHVDADRVGHEVLADDPDVIEAVRDIAGHGVFDAEDRVDRRELGKVVFADPAKLERFNGVVHPKIRKRCGELIESAREKGVPFAVVEAALLLDAEMPFEYDLMIALRADRQVQLRRLGEKGGWSDDEVRARLGNQRHIENSFYKADAVLDTAKERSEVLAEVDRLVDEVLAK